MGEKKPQGLEMTPFQVGCDEVLFHLGGSKYLIINKDHSDKALPRQLGDKLQARLRICDLSGDPTKTKKLIRLNVQQWVDLISWMPIINIITSLEVEKEGSGVIADDGIKRMSLGGNVYVTLKKGRSGMDIRWYWLPHDNTVDLYVRPDEFDVQPTRYGIWLKYTELRQLQQLVPIVKQLMPELNDMRCCETSHDAQEALLRCDHCNPNGYIAWI